MLQQGLYYNYIVLTGIWSNFRHEIIGCEYALFPFIINITSCLFIYVTTFFYHKLLRTCDVDKNDEAS